MEHPLKGRKQNPEHVARRVQAWRASAASEKSGARFIKLNKSRAGQPLPETTRAKQSASMLGKQNSLGVKRDEAFRRKLATYWAENRESHNHYVDGKGAGRTTERQRDMARLDYRLWRESVFKRDNWTCVECGQRGGQLHADHIKPYGRFPDLRYEIENGRTMCAPCHRKTDTYGGRAIRHARQRHG